MKEKELLTIKRHIELEEWLQKHYPHNKSNSEVVQIFFNKFESLEDIDYLIDAYLIPKKEIEKSLENYDSHKFPFVMDELKFVDDLAEKYNVYRSKIIKRIIEVRRINIVEKAGFEVKKHKKRKK